MENLFLLPRTARARFNKSSSPCFVHKQYLDGKEETKKMKRRAPPTQKTSSPLLASLYSLFNRRIFFYPKKRVARVGQIQSRVATRISFWTKWRCGKLEMNIFGVQVVGENECKLVSHREVHLFAFPCIFWGGPPSWKFSSDVAYTTRVHYTSYFTRSPWSSFK